MWSLCESQILEHLPSEVGISFPKIPYCHSKGFSLPCFHGVFNAIGKIPSPTGQFTIPKPTCNDYGISAMHIWHLSLIVVLNLAPHELTTIALCQIDQMKAPSLLLCILSHALPHFNLSLGGMMSCHLVTTDLGRGFCGCNMFPSYGICVTKEVFSWVPLKTYGVHV